MFKFRRKNEVGGLIVFGKVEERERREREGEMAWGRRRMSRKRRREG